MLGKMLKLSASALGGLVLLATATPAAAQWGGTCTRESLQEVADKYIEAQTQGVPLLLPMSREWFDYNENFKMATMSTGLLSTPLKIDWHLTLLDATQCRFFVEAVALNPENPYVFATQISATTAGAGNASVVISEEHDWLFNAQNTYEYARREDWSVIPEDKRNTREELLAAANAYLDLFKDKTTQVPWGTPCNRLEGGIYTGTGSPEDSCNVGVPENIDMANRRYVVDETIGAVSVFLDMGPSKRPDSHLFRVEDGKLRYVHTVTNCGTDVNCGFPPVDWSKQPKPPGV